MTLLRVDMRYDLPIKILILIKTYELTNNHTVTESENIVDSQTPKE